MLSVLVFSQHQAGVVAAQSKRIGEYHLRVNLSRGVGHVIQITFRVRRFVIDCRMNRASLDRLDASDGFQRAGAGSLPTFAGRYRQYREAFPKDGVQVAIKVTSQREHGAVADLVQINHLAGRLWHGARQRKIGGQGVPREDHPGPVGDDRRRELALEAAEVGGVQQGAGGGERAEPGVHPPRHRRLEGAGRDRETALSEAVSGLREEVGGLGKRVDLKQDAASAVQIGDRIKALEGESRGVRESVTAVTDGVSAVRSDVSVLTGECQDNRRALNLLSGEVSGLASTVAGLEAANRENAKRLDNLAIQMSAVTAAAGKERESRAGIERALREPDGLAQVDKLAGRIRVIPLSGSPTFERHFLEQMDFPGG